MSMRACCDHSMAIEEINQSHELTRQLKALLMRLLPPGGWSDVAEHCFKEILRCSSSALARLQAHVGPDASDAISGHEHRRRTIPDDKRKSYDGREMINCNKRARKTSSSSIVTTMPYEDGYQWRKYGQKLITGGRHPRSYFRCTFSKDLGCPATKTVQQRDMDCYPPKFMVNYSMHHTCRSSDVNLPVLVMESAANEEASLPHNIPDQPNKFSRIPKISIHSPRPPSIITTNQNQGDYDHMPAGDQGPGNDHQSPERLTVAQATPVDMTDQMDSALNQVMSLASLDFDMTSWANILESVVSAEVRQYY